MDPRRATQATFTLANGTIRNRIIRDMDHDMQFLDNDPSISEKVNQVLNGLLLPEEVEDDLSPDDLYGHRIIGYYHLYVFKDFSRARKCFIKSVDKMGRSLIDLGFLEKIAKNYIDAFFYFEYALQYSNVSYIAIRQFVSLCLEIKDMRNLHIFAERIFGSQDTGNITSLQINLMSFDKTNMCYTMIKKCSDVLVEIMEDNYLPCERYLNYLFSRNRKEESEFHLNRLYRLTEIHPSSDLLDRILFYWYCYYLFGRDLENFMKYYYLFNDTNEISVSSHWDIRYGFKL